MIVEIEMCIRDSFRSVRVRLQAFNGPQALSALFQFLGVNILFRIDDLIQRHGLQNGAKIAHNPIQRHADGYKPAQVEANPHRKQHGSILVPQALFLSLIHI